MSLFDTLIGSTSNGSTGNKSTSDQTQAEEKNTTQNTAATTQQDQTQNTSGNTTAKTNTAQANTSQATGQSSSLNSGVVNTVSDLINHLAGGNGQVSDIVSALISKASTPAISDADINTEQNKAKLDFSQGEVVDIAGGKNRIGSNLNTYSALLDQKGQQDLSTTLANVVAQAKATNSQVSTQQLLDALQGSQIGSNQVASLVEALKGANTTTSQNIAGSTSQDTTADTVQKVLEALNGTTTANQNATTDETTAATATGSTTSDTQGKQGSGLLGMLF